MGPSTEIFAGATNYTWLWGYLLPIGLLLLAWGGLSPERARRVAPAAATALALAILGYWAIGFALHLGGAQAVIPQDASLQGLDALFSIIPGDPGWGIAGLAGFFLSGNTGQSGHVPALSDLSSADCIGRPYGDTCAGPHAPLADGGCRCVDRRRHCACRSLLDVGQRLARPSRGYAGARLWIRRLWWQHAGTVATRARRVADSAASASRTGD